MGSISADELRTMFSPLRINVDIIIGYGAASIVYSGVSTRDQRKLAIKVPSRVEHEPYFMKEIETLKVIKKAGGNTSITDLLMSRPIEEGIPFMIFHQYGPSLFDAMRETNRTISPDHILQMTRMLLQAIDFMHCEVKYLHGDIKPENILLKDQRYLQSTNFSPEIVVIDLGSAVSLDNYKAMQNVNQALIGTKPYQAPEQTMRLALTEKIDVWALGCTIFELYRGWPLFQHNGLEEHLVILQWLFQRSIPSTMLFEYYRRNVKPVDSDELDPPPEKRAKTGTPDYDAIYTTNCDLPIPQQAMIDGLKAIHYGPEIDLIRYLGIPRSDEEEIVHKLIIETLKILPVCRPSLRELLRDFFNSV